MTCVPMPFRRFLRQLFIVLALAAISQTWCAAQDGPGDSSLAPPLPAPAQPTASGTRSSTAIDELSKHMQAVYQANASVLNNLQASGTITYFAAQKEITGPADLTLSSRGIYKLVTKLPDGTRTLALTPLGGKLTEADGTVAIIPRRNGFVGIAAFQRIRDTALVTDRRISVTDLGIVNVGDAALRRISLSAPLAGLGSQSDWVATDFYFDPQSHLLIYSVDNVRDLDYRDPTNYPRILLFSDYRPVEGILIPFAITEFFCGQKTWTLQLDQASVNAPQSTPGL